MAEKVFLVDVNMSGNKVKNPAFDDGAIAIAALATNPLARANHTGTQTAATISDFNTQVRTNRLDQMAAPTASVAMNSQKFTGAAAATAAGQFVEYAQWQNALNGTDWKSAVKVRTTANITLSGEQTIDGVAVVAGDRVLVANQLTGAQNGIYVVAVGSWSRSVDQPASSSASGDSVFVDQGGTYGNTQWTCSNDIGSDVVGANALTFVQIGAATVYTADNSTLVLSGNQFAIKSTYSGQTSIVTVGTITAGTWQGTAVGVTYGGTGATTAANARANLGLAIGSDVQAYDADLAAIAGLTSAADSAPYFTGSGTAALMTVTAFARTLLDDASSSAALTTLGAQPLDAELTAIAGLTSAADSAPYFTGSGTAALMTVTSFARTLLDDANAATARATLGLAIGSDVQAYDAELAAIAGLTSAADKVPYFTGSGTAALMTVTAFARSVLDDADSATALATLGAQPLDAELTAIAGLVSASDKAPYFTGSGTASLMTVTSFARTILDDTNAAGVLSTIGAQASDAELTAIAGLTSAADTAPYFTGSGTAALMTVTSFARTLLDDADATTALATLGAQPLDDELTAIAGLTSAANTAPYFTGSGSASLMSVTAFARTLLDDANSAAALVTLGAQPLDAELTAISGLVSAADSAPYFTGSGTAALMTVTSFARTLLDDASASDMRSTLGLAIGTNVQAYDAELAAIAGLTSAANTAPYFTGSGTAALMAVTGFARTILDDADATTVRSTIGATGKYSTLIGNGSSTAIAVTHGLNSQDVIVSVHDAATFAEVECQVVKTDANTVTLSFNTAPATNAYRVTVIG